jgi:outer membrane lipopolysaccharide assembly protein LptE/RlpB
VRRHFFKGSAASASPSPQIRAIQRSPFGSPAFKGSAASASPLPQVRAIQRSPFGSPARFFAATPLLLAVLLTGCGYHTAGKSSRLPASVHVLAVPVFVNQTQVFRIEQVMTQDVVREFIDRTKYQVTSDGGGSADATLKGTVVSAQAAPLTYDAQSGRISSAMVTITAKVTLTDRNGRVLFENLNYTFREQYQVSSEINSFFAEQTPAMQRLSRDFARTLVADILEGY